MSRYAHHYSMLLGSAEQLAHCQQALSLEDLLSRIRNLWQCDELNDQDLLSEIQQLNQIPVDNSVQLAGNWLPYRYHPKKRLVYWLIPVGHATEPFQDQYISRCRQHLLLNQIIQPTSSLQGTIEQASACAATQPAGFIFHVSRCGSTLVSGCLSELDSTCVFSESPLLTELLLDCELSGEERKIFLRTFINLQAAAFPHRPQVIIKWNAWDIFQWELIRDLYPRVPAVFLVRNPLEVLASHQKSAGRHMAGDGSLVHMHPWLQQQNQDSTLLEYQMQVMHALVRQMLVVSESVRIVDYCQLNIARITELCRWFGCEINPLVLLKIQDRLGFHSKHIGQVFSADTEQKRQAFTAEDTARIWARLEPVYNELLKMTHVTGAKVINA